MATYVVRDAVVNLDGRDISGLTNQVTLDYGCDLQDSTPINSRYMRRVPGLTMSSYEVQGFWDGELDESLFPQVGERTSTLMIRHDSSNRGFMLRGTAGKFDQGASIGEVAPFTYMGESTDHVIQGTVYASSPQNLTFLPGQQTVDLVIDTLDTALTADQALYLGLGIEFIELNNRPQVIDVSVIRSTTTLLERIAQPAGSTFEPRFYYHKIEGPSARAASSVEIEFNITNVYTQTVVLPNAVELFVFMGVGRR